MAKNGVAVRFAPEPAAAPAATAIQIGIAMADACEAIGRSLADLDAGGLTAANRTLNGERLAVVVELWLAHFGEIDDFRGRAQREGRRVLLERHAAEMHRLLSADVPEVAVARTFDELCACVVTAAGRVVAIELAYRSN